MGYRLPAQRGLNLRVPGKAGSRPQCKFANECLIEFGDLTVKPGERAPVF
jgi:hypothetical protein